MRKGFTLVELLAVIVLLALITMVAVPNVIGIIDNNKKTTFITDAKMFASRVEAHINASTEIAKPSATDELVVVYLSALEGSDIKISPEGGNYDKGNGSLVAIRLETSGEGSRLKYWVQLIDESGRGVEFVKLDSISKSSVKKHVQGIGTAEVASKFSGINSGKVTIFN